MTYPAAAVGAAAGMMFGLVIFANAWRLDLLPKDYDFIHEFGKALVRSDRKRITYAARFITGIVFHPVLFAFVWGREGVLGVYPLQSDVLSALLLVTIEAGGFAYLLWKGILIRVPNDLVRTVIRLQFAVHLLLGLLMGLSYATFA